MRAATVGHPAAVPAIIATQPVFAIGATVDMAATEVTVTANASANTKGAWSEVIASTSADCDFVLLLVRGVSGSATDTSALLDLGIGAAASEVAIVSNMPIGSAAMLLLLLPVHIPAGTRVAVRNQSVIGGDTATVTISTAASAVKGMRSPTYLDTYGADTANSKGTGLPTSDTYVEITSATTQPYAGLVPLVAVGGTVISQATIIETVAVGASGSEVAVTTASWHTTTIESLWSVSQNTTAGSPFNGVASRHIPAGTRIAAKHAVGRTYGGAVVLGIPYA